MPGLAHPSTDEKTLLLAYITQQREGIRNAAFGLTDEQARMTTPTSTLTVGGLVKHVAMTEQHWIDMVLQRDRETTEEKMARYEYGFTLLPDETLALVLADYADVAAETEAVIGAIEDLNQPVPVPKGVPWFPQDVDAWSVRWVLLHIIEETARHAGHADLVRESIDGATMYPLMAAAEGWPATDWLQPWQPAS